MKEKAFIQKSGKASSVMSIVRSADILNRYLQIELAKHGSNPIRFGLMNALFVHGGEMTPTAISKWLFRSKHSITGMLDALEKLGLIRREANHNDRRSVKILVTDTGWKSTRRMSRAAEEIGRRAVSCFTDEELETLMNLLRKFRKHLLNTLNEPR
jgi:DNA-binding MarR family transcriptional regulator